MYAYATPGAVETKCGHAENCFASISSRMM